MPDEVLIQPSDPMLTTPSHGEWPIIVHCHLRWDFVWQRPQQLFSRLARHHRVLFLEEPVFADVAEATLQMAEAQPNLIRVVPTLPRGAHQGESDAGAGAVRELLRTALQVHPMLKGQFDSPVEWFYSPMTAPSLQGQFGEVATVYDCMDELANFRFAPPDIGDREKFLLGKADVVFTGGYELLQSKAKLHPNVHFHGCGVDVAHYAKARDWQLPVPPELADLPHPILGYFGVIDERLDYDLIAHLARTFDRGSVVMVGPHAKVDPAALPRFPNVHWLGQRSYEDLPMLVKAFDVCLMPFALNEATKFINPTKTLEYMAAGKPVVCTAVPDVVRRFKAHVAIGNDMNEFVAHIEKALEYPDLARIESGLVVAANSSWDAIVADMQSEIAAAVIRRTSV